MKRREFIKRYVLKNGLLVPLAAPLIVPRIVRAASMPQQTPARGASSVSYLLQEDFEGTGLPASGSGGWSSAGSPDYDYSTSGLSLSGSQCLRLPTSAGSCRAFTGTFAATVDGWVYFEVNPETIATGDTVLVLRQTSGAALMQIDVDATGHLRCDDGTITSSYTTDAMSTASAYEVRVHYVAGGGANAQYSVEFIAKGGSFAGSGNKFSQSAIGVATLGFTSLRFAAESGACAWRIDRVRAADVIIGGNPS